MQSKKHSVRDTLKRLSKKEIEKAFSWIDSLSEKDLARFKEFSQVQLAHAVLEMYLKKKTNTKQKAQAK